MWALHIGTYFYFIHYILIYQPILLYLWRNNRISFIYGISQRMRPLNILIINPAPLVFIF
jgi:hypothetical protein